MFDGTASYYSLVNMFLPRTISPGFMCKVSKISSGQSETECLHDKIVSRFFRLPDVVPGGITKRSVFMAKGGCHRREMFFFG